MSQIAVEKSSNNLNVGPLYVANNFLPLRFTWDSFECLVIIFINIISSKILCDFVTFLSPLAPTVNILFYLLVSHERLSFSIEHKFFLFLRFDHLYCPVFKFGIPLAYSNISRFFFFIWVSIFLTLALPFVFIQPTCSFIPILFIYMLLTLSMSLFTSWAPPFFIIFEF